ncbi:hypothetical protein HV436_04120 [Bacillus sporothermodurans]|nr:hypothetical protein [Heyndrickxia sporothermodurans]
MRIYFERYNSLFLMKFYQKPLFVLFSIGFLLDLHIEGNSELLYDMKKTRMSKCDSHYVDHPI